MFYTVAKIIVGFFMRILFRFEVIGNSNPNQKEKYIIVSNHSSILDPVVLGLCFKPQIHFMAKKELFDNKFMGFIYKKLNAFPVDREGNDIGALKNSVKLIKSNKIVGVFIEGTRVKGFDPKNAKAGPILIAKMAKAKIIPVHIESSYRLFSKITVNIRDSYEIVLDKGSKDDAYINQARKVLDIIYNG